MFSFMATTVPAADSRPGVIIAAAFILHALIFGLEAGRRLVPGWVNLAMLAGGVIVYGGVGVAGMMLDGLFLTTTCSPTTPPRASITASFWWNSVSG